MNVLRKRHNESIYYNIYIYIVQSGVHPANGESSPNTQTMRVVMMEQFFVEDLNKIKQVQQIRNSLLLKEVSTVPAPLGKTKSEYSPTSPTSEPIIYLQMRMCMLYIYIHIIIYICIYAYVHMRYISIYIYICNIYIYTYHDLHMHLCICTYEIYLYVYIYIYIFNIYIYGGLLK